MKHFKGLLSAILLVTAIGFVACKPSTGTDNNGGGSGGSGGSSGGSSTRQEVSGKIGKYGSPYEVGDIVFNDGSAMPYTDFAALDTATKNAKKTSAIALIFYKGTGLNSGDDTTTSRTLGVGLKHNQTGLAWCLSSANACYKDITTIQCLAGSRSFTGDKNGSDNLEQIEAFEGVDDTATAEKYPAFYFGKNYKEQKIGSETASRIAADSEFVTGWYLPSIAELFQIYACREDTSNGFDIDAASEALDGDKFGTSLYWSSSQNDSSVTSASAYLLSFDDGDWTNDSKYSEYYVCCIRAFNQPKADSTI